MVCDVFVSKNSLGDSLRKAREDEVAEGGLGDRALQCPSRCVGRPSLSQRRAPAMQGLWSVGREEPGPLSRVLKEALLPLSARSRLQSSGFCEFVVEL